MAANLLIEACVDSLAGALAAEKAGADRIELNYALQLDGLTPSAGLVHQVMQAVSIPVIGMSRCRDGDFVYSDLEWSTIVTDAAWLIDQGVAGIACGCLEPNGDIQFDRVRQLREIAADAELVFHKAFDATSDSLAAIDVLSELGVDRVMTSGRQPDSLTGAECIAGLRNHAAGRIEILPAGGINSGNALEIVQATGVDQLHGSFSGGRHHDFDSVHTEIIKVRSSLGLLE